MVLQAHVQARAILVLEEHAVRHHQHLLRLFLRILGSGKAQSSSVMVARLLTSYTSLL